MERMGQYKPLAEQGLAVCTAPAQRYLQAYETASVVLTANSACIQCEHAGVTASNVLDDVPEMLAAAQPQ